MSRFDLHLHSRHSDGFLTPEQLVGKCQKHGLTGAALTDHDCVAGLAAFCRQNRFITIPGVEITANHRGEEVHILGYCLDWRHHLLKATLAKIVTARNERAREILRRLNKAGVEVSWEDVAGYATGEFVGRLHIYRALKARRVIGEDPEMAAFRHYLGPQGVAYVPHQEFPALEAISLVRQAGGHPVLAHPGRLNDRARARDDYALLKGLTDGGLEGLEVFYPAHTPSMVAGLAALARKYGLFMTGGSDYHGWANEPGPGTAAVEGKYIEKLLADCTAACGVDRKDG